jgi:hypothetical protein
VQCYAPTQSAELIDKEALYSLLDKTLLGIKRSGIIVMMGDYNAQVGKKGKVPRWCPLALQPIGLLYSDPEGVPSFISRGAEALVCMQRLS